MHLKRAKLIGKAPDAEKDWRQEEKAVTEYMPRCEIAGSYGSSLYSFQGTSLLFSTVAVPIYIPTLNASLDTSVYDS